MNQPAIDALAVLQSLGISTDQSVHRGIQRVTEILDGSSSRLNAANRIIVRLGCSPQKDEKHAELIAKALVEQAWNTGRMYDPQVAVEVAQKKYEHILHNMPYIFINTATEPVPGAEGESEARIVSKRVKKASGGEANDKEKAIRQMYDELKGTMNNNQLCKKIAAQLDLTPANVSYYINRKLNR